MGTTGAPEQATVPAPTSPGIPEQRSVRILLTFVLLFQVSAVADAVSDPAAALRTLYKSYEAGAIQAPNAGIEKIWELAGPQLRRRLVTNGVCTIPLGKRAFRCALDFDPIVGGVSGARLIDMAAGKADPKMVRIVARLDGGGVTQTVAFIFARNGDQGAKGGHVLVDIEGERPGEVAWRLSELSPYAKL